MALTLDTLDGTLWLCDPVQLRLAAARVLAHRTCPTARELAAERRLRLDAAAAPVVIAGGLDSFHPEEQAAAKPVRGVKGGVGVIPIYGVIEQRLSAELMKAGGTSVEEISAGLDSLLANKAVDAIVFDVASPGGEISGVPELAGKIMGARGQKKLYAVANSMAASAAFWLASAAEQLFITPSGYAGSVGVYMMHIDKSKAAEAAGVTVSLIHAGKYKVEGNPYEPLGAETRDNLQSMVDATYGSFIDALSVQRDVGVDHVRKRFGQGRLLNAADAIEAGMADRKMSLEDLLGRLVGGESVKTSSRGLKLKHEAAKAGANERSQAFANARIEVGK